MVAVQESNSFMWAAILTEGQSQDIYIIRLISSLTDQSTTIIRVCQGLTSALSASAEAASMSSIPFSSEGEPRRYPSTLS